MTNLNKILYALFFTSCVSGLLPGASLTGLGSTVVLGGLLAFRDYLSKKEDIKDLQSQLDLFKLHLEDNQKIMVEQQKYFEENLSKLRSQIGIGRIASPPSAPNLGRRL